jgi:hypothetical protein
MSGGPIPQAIVHSDWLTAPGISVAYSAQSCFGGRHRAGSASFWFTPPAGVSMQRNVCGAVGAFSAERLTSVFKASACFSSGHHPKINRGEIVIAQAE